MQIFRGPPLIIAIIKMQISNFNWMNDYLKLLVINPNISYKGF